MRWTRLVLAAALLVSVAPAADGAGRSTDQTKARRFAEWLDAKQRVGRGLPTAVTHEMVEDYGHYARLSDAGDLDGDGGRDLVDVRTHVTYDEVAGFVEQVRLDAYRGRDGKALWSVSLPPASAVFPVLTPVGLDGKPGVLVVSYTDASFATDVNAFGGFTAAVTSFDGAGRPLWSSTLPGLWNDSIAEYAGSDAAVVGLLDAVKGGGTDLLVQGAAAVGVGTPTGDSPERVAVQFGILDGATGTLRPVGTPIESDWDQPWGFPVGDLDKDGLADFTVDVGAADGASLRALSSADGEVLWTRAKYAGADSLRWVEPIPDATGDGVPDIATSDVAFDFFVIGPGSGAAMRPQEFASLVDGKTGAVRWRKAGDPLMVLGNVDRKPGVEVAMGQSTYDTHVGFGVSVFTASGKRVWTQSRKVRSDPKAPGASLSWSAFTDFNADGVTDIGYGLVGGSGAKAKRDEGWLDGRTGRVHRDPKPGMFGTRAAFDGRGGDAYLRSLTGGVLTLEAWRGDAPTRLWTVGVRVGSSLGFNRTTAVSVDGDRCDDLAIGVTDFQTHLDVVLSGGTGKPLWTLSRKGAETATVGKAAVTRHQVFRKSC